MMRALWLATLLGSSTAILRGTDSLLAREALEQAAIPTGEGVIDRISDNLNTKARNDAFDDASRAMKFQEISAGTSLTDGQSAALQEAAGAGIGALGPEKFTPKTFKVAPGDKGGFPVKPAPGQNDPVVHIRPRYDYAEAVKMTSDYLGAHSYKDDIKSLLMEIDRSENTIKGLKLRIVEKENFIDSLVKREDMLQEDVNKDKTAVENLHSHVKALRARVERIKKTKQLAELQAQYNEYSAAATKLKGQADELSKVKGALESKIVGLEDRVSPLLQKENYEMRASIDVGNAMHHDHVAGGGMPAPMAEDIIGGSAAGESGPAKK